MCGRGCLARSLPARVESFFAREGGRQMKTLHALLVSILISPAASLAAQGLAASPCPHGTTNALGIPDQQRVAEDACVQAYDLFHFLAPQLGITLAGGNATIGQGSTLGGLGHFSVGVRGNVVAGSVPDVGSYQQSSTG